MTAFENVCLDHVKKVERDGSAQVADDVYESMT